MSKGSLNAVVVVCGDRILGIAVGRASRSFHFHCLVGRGVKWRRSEGLHIRVGAIFGTCGNG